MGTNQVAIQEQMDAMNIPRTQRPSILTLEMCADVALAQRIGLGLGTRVRFTGGDATMKTCPMFPTTTPVGVEHLFLVDNQVLTADERRRVVWLNLDYCGGPLRSHDSRCGERMMRVFARAPALRMITVTMARRNHADLEATFDEYVPIPYGFRLENVFYDNRRVICKMYVRDTSVVRNLAIPSHWWTGGTVGRVHDGVVIARNGAMHDVYVPDDDAVYTMRADAIACYAAS